MTNSAQAPRLTVDAPPVPKVGEGVTVQIGSDSYAATIIKVSASGKTLHIQRDRAHPTKANDYYGAQSHVFTADPTAEVEKATLRWDGRYRLKGCSNYGGLTIGRRRAYHDPCF